jgi:hypothetical protein
MNYSETKRFTALIIAIFLLPNIILSQSKFNMDLIKGGLSDGEKIISGYISPWLGAFGAGLNGSWYTTAKPHKLGGFDVTASVNFSLIPSSEKTFDLNAIGLTDTKFLDPSGSTIAQTIAGSKNEGPGLYIESMATGSPVKMAEYKTPAGTGLNFMFAPMVQAAVGLPFGTELKVRYLPQIPVNRYGNVSLWGVGIMHSIIQYIPGYAMLPVDLSVFGGYTRFTANLPISMQPDDYSNYTSAYSSSSFTGQKFSPVLSAINVSLVGSAKVLIFTVYGSVGYVKTSTSLKFRGLYPFPEVNSSTGVVEYKDANVQALSPIDIKGFSGVKATVGLRIKLSVLAFNVDYSRAEYNVVSAGFGVSFR